MPKALFARASFDEDFSYVAGVILGDGHIGETRKERRIPCQYVALTNTDLDFVTEFAQKLSNLIGPGTAKIRSTVIPHYKLRYSYRRHSHWLYTMLNRPVPEIFQDTKSLMFFLKGLFDSDGCISYRKVGGRLYKHVIFYTTTTDIKDTIQQILETIGIRYSIYVTRTRKKKLKDGHWLIPNNPNYYQIRLSTKQAIERFAELIPPLIPHKQSKLEQLLQEMKTHGCVDAETGRKIISPAVKKKLATATTVYWNGQLGKKRKEEQSTRLKRVWRDKHTQSTIC
jgi:intein-encoded DNA endonuclease-like protein